MDKSHAGVRVKAKYQIKGYGPLILAGWEGEIVYEQDNGLGQRLIYVRWRELGASSPVFIEDIEVLT